MSLAADSSRSAGGIGQTLFESIRAFQYAETAAQILIVVVTVVAIDIASARLRKSLVCGVFGVTMTWRTLLCIP